MSQAWVYLELPLPPPLVKEEEVEKDRGIEILDLFGTKEEDVWVKY
jgi:hypothetical protein